MPYAEKTPNANAATDAQISIARSNRSVIQSAFVDRIFGIFGISIVLRVQPKLFSFRKTNRPSCFGHIDQVCIHAENAIAKATGFNIGNSKLLFKNSRDASAQ
jgi:hypothetical protein